MRKKDPQIEAIEQKRRRLRKKLMKRLGGDFPISNEELHFTEKGKRLKEWGHRMVVEAHKKLYAKLDSEKNG